MQRDRGAKTRGTYTARQLISWVRGKLSKMKQPSSAFFMAETWCIPVTICLAAGGGATTKAMDTAMVAERGGEASLKGRGAGQPDIRRVGLGGSGWGQAARGKSMWGCGEITVIFLV